MTDKGFDPEDARKLAEAVRRIDKGMKALTESGLKRAALVVLLADLTGVSKRDVNAVLDGLDDFSKTYLEVQPRAAAREFHTLRWTEKVGDENGPPKIEELRVTEMTATREPTEKNFTEENFLIWLLETVLKKYENTPATPGTLQAIIENVRYELNHYDFTWGLGAGLGFWHIDATLNDRCVKLDLRPRSIMGLGQVTLTKIDPVVGGQGSWEASVSGAQTTGWGESPVRALIDLGKQVETIARNGDNQGAQHG